MKIAGPLLFLGGLIVLLGGGWRTARRILLLPSLRPVFGHEFPTGALIECLIFPREIVSELDRHIIGQKDAKRAVATAAIAGVASRSKKA